MKFYFDESGSFRIPDERVHAVGIVVGIAIPDNCESAFFARLEEFINELPRSAFKEKEPKGNLLGTEDRRRFAEIVAGFDDVLICPAMCDLTSVAGEGVQRRDRFAKKLQDTAAMCIHETMREEMGLLARQAANLSPVQFSRLGSWAFCVKRCLQDSLVMFGDNQLAWNDMKFVIDLVQAKKGSREESVFTKILPAWLAAWSAKDPFVLIDEIHTADHPFVKKWDREKGLDLGRIFRENVHFISSHDSLGIQAADMAASVTSKAVVGLVDLADLKSYGLMMMNALRSNEHAHGIFSFGDIDEKDVVKRYLGLVDSLAVARINRDRAEARRKRTRPRT